MILNENAPMIRDWCLTCQRYTLHDNGSILGSGACPLMIVRCRTCCTERTWR